FQNGNSRLSEQFIRWRLWNSWTDVVGREIGARTLPVGLKGGILFIWVKNSVWMQELQFLAEPIREKINTFVGRKFAKEIRFTLDRKTVPRPEETESGLREFLSEELPNGDGEPRRGR